MPLTREGTDVREYKIPAFYEATTIVEVTEIPRPVDKEHAIVGTTSEGLVYKYNSSSASTADGVTILQPLDTTWDGRWELLRIDGGGPINVKWFGAVGDNTTDDTAALQAAIDYTKTPVDGEPGLLFPAGQYLVTTLNLVGLKNTKFYAGGSVFINGSGTGNDELINIDGATVNSTTNLEFIGTFGFQANTGTYLYGFNINDLINSRLRFTCSGSFSVATVNIDFSWDNTFEWLNLSNTDASAMVWKEDSASVNNNRHNLRFSGTASNSGQIGLRCKGQACSYNGDLSTIGTGLSLSGARGNKFTLYIENVGAPVDIEGGINRGNSFLGGFIEVLGSSSGIELTGSGTTQGTLIAGVRFKGFSGAVSRVAVSMGAQAYGLVMLANDFEDIDTSVSGTWRGASGGFASSVFSAFRSNTSGALEMAGGIGEQYTSLTFTAFNPDVSLYNFARTNVTAATAFTIANPTNPVQIGQRIEFLIKNGSGGVMGVITWGAQYKMSAWTNPANGFSRSIAFRWDGGQWLEVSKTESDIPN